MDSEMNEKFTQSVSFDEALAKTGNHQGFNQISSTFCKLRDEKRIPFLPFSLCARIDENIDALKRIALT